MKWITRKDIKVDRLACPWLIKRFIDPQAEFLFVEEKDLLEKSKQEGGDSFRCSEDRRENDRREERGIWAGHSKRIVGPT